jgi:hypothetical protein
MKFTELQSVAGEMGPERVEGSLRELMRDPRFGAVLRILYDLRQQLVHGGSSPSVAAGVSAPTLMAHYLGAIDAIGAVEARLAAICDEA